MRVHNDTSSSVTVNSEVGYGCTADAGDTCSFTIAVGKHTLKAKRSDNGKTRTEEVNVTADPYDFDLKDGNP